VFTNKFDLIIPSKLHEPPLNQNVVVRSRLIDNLNEGLKKKLTLVSAPAGFGKTTLVLSWLKNVTIPVSWISLDEQDDDLARFFTYLITSITKYKPGSLEYFENMLNSLRMDSSHAEDMNFILHELISKPPFSIIVLDDYHTIKHSKIHEAMCYLLQNLPYCNDLATIPIMGCHFVIITRSDPPFPLTRWKLNNELTEIRTSDLRFSLQECNSMFNDVHHFGLSSDEIKRLSDRTQGWIASMQLVALSLADLQPNEYSSHIQNIKGNNRLITDYLSEEVYSHLDDETRSFLLQTSILDLKNGSLCDAITHKTNSQSRLELLEKSNIFVMPMDEERCWFKYHPLFNDFLSSKLANDSNYSTYDLHQRAAQWFEKNGYIEDSLRHWMAIKRYDEAARVVTEFSPQILSRAQFYILKSIIEEFPENAFQVWPWLCIYRAWAYFLQDLDLVEIWLKSADELLAKEEIRIQYTPNNINEMLGNIAALRALCASRVGDFDEILQNAPKALDFLPSDVKKVRGLVLNATAGGQALQFNLDDAYDNFIQAKEILIRGGNIGGAAEAIAKAGEIKLIIGKLQSAEFILKSAIDLEKNFKTPDLAISCRAFSLLGEVYFEWDRVDEALTLLNEGCLKSKLMGPSERVFCDLSLANVLLHLGQIENADKIISKYSHEDNSQIVLPWDRKMVIGNRAFLYALQGKKNETLRLIMDHDNIKLKPDINSEACLMSFAFSLYHLKEYDMCLNITQPLVEKMDLGRRYGREIKMLTLTSSALVKKGDVDSSLQFLVRGVHLSGEERYYRPYLDLVDPILDNLMVLYKNDSLLIDIADSKYLSDIIQRFLSTSPGHIYPNTRSENKVVQNVDPIGFSDYITDQEKKVLKLLLAGSNNKEIASELSISVNTVKKHVSNIYAKLNVHTRFQASVRIQQLNIMY
jgi:LuxR family transcriptional regulator, maltose regulon positive regulatory protein